MKGRGSKGSHSRGQALVEAALVLPVFVLILFALFDFGRGVYAYNTIGNAARAGARVAAVNQIPDSPDCVNTRPVVDLSDPHWSIRRCAADAAISLGVEPSDVEVTYLAPPGSALTCLEGALELDCIVRVTVHYDYIPSTPIFTDLFLADGINLDQVSEMPIERIFP